LTAIMHSVTFAAQTPEKHASPVLFFASPRISATKITTVHILIIFCQ